MSTTTETTTESTDLDQAWAAWEAATRQPFGPVLLAATVKLEAAAEAAEKPLCSWGDPTPYDVTVRSCCGDAVCEEHEEDHDLLCREFGRQLLEEQGR